jgi:hypothetical protein
MQPIIDLSVLKSHATGLRLRRPTDLGLWWRAQVTEINTRHPGFAEWYEYNGHWAVVLGEASVNTAKPKIVAASVATPHPNEQHGSASHELSRRYFGDDPTVLRRLNTRLLFMAGDYRFSDLNTWVDWELTQVDPQIAELIGLSPEEASDPAFGYTFGYVRTVGFDAHPERSFPIRFEHNGFVYEFDARSADNDALQHLIRKYRPTKWCSHHDANLSPAAYVPWEGPDDSMFVRAVPGFARTVGLRLSGGPPERLAQGYVAPGVTRGNSMLSDLTAAVRSTESEKNLGVDAKRGGGASVTDYLTREL